MLSCQLMGGLGNQLFQICATLAWSFQTGQPVRFIQTETVGKPPDTVRPTYWNSIFKPLVDAGWVQSTPLPNLPLIYEHPDGYYHPLPALSSGKLVGYFQSHYYFQSWWPAIHRLLAIDSWPVILPIEPGTVSIHIRRGDYRRHPTVHPILPVSYYLRCVDFIHSRSPISSLLMFHDPSDSDDASDVISALSSRFPIQRCDATLTDWQQLIAMSQCTHHIIANSSYSWWGAYLASPKSDHIVCYPSIWFGPSIPLHDRFPDTWHRIECNPPG